MRTIERTGQFKRDYKRESKANSRVPLGALLAAIVQSLANNQRVNIFLDGAVVQHFKSIAGARGYQTLVNEALKQSIHAQAIEQIVRKTIREELRRD